MENIYFEPVEDISSILGGRNKAAEVADAFVKAMQDGVRAAKLTGISASAMQSWLRNNPEAGFKVVTRGKAAYLIAK